MNIKTMVVGIGLTCLFLTIPMLYGQQAHPYVEEEPDSIICMGLVLEKTGDGAHKHPFFDENGLVSDTIITHWTMIPIYNIPHDASADSIRAGVFKHIKQIGLSDSLEAGILDSITNRIKIIKVPRFFSILCSQIKPRNEGSSVNKS